jgi:hypothetical protein
MANNESVVVVGDFNETQGTNPRLMAKVCAEQDLFDVLSPNAWIIACPLLRSNLSSPYAGTTCSMDTFSPIIELSSLIFDFKKLDMAHRR